MAKQLDEQVAEGTETTPTIYEPVYWDQDDVRIGAAYEALLVPGTTNTIDGSRFEEFESLGWQLEVDNRLRQKEMALKIGELMAQLAELTAPEAKPARAKRAVRVPKAALPDEPDAA